MLLPTRRWTTSCDRLVEQLRPGDELLVLCDRPTDAVAVDPPAPAPGTRVEVVPVGDPDGCSGKAHALAVGLSRATDDLVVLTDDDVERGPAWLSTMVRLASDHGAASATPVFLADGSGWWRLFEPAMVTLGSSPICRYGGAWGGGVAFARDRLDEDRFRRDLERTVSDDALLWDCLEEVHTSPAVVNEVRVGGGAREVRDRLVRFVLTYRFWLPRATLALWGLWLVFLVALLVAPVLTAVGVTALALVAYRSLGVRRRTWLLAVPAALVLPVVLADAWLRPRFRWGGRRYAWRGRFDVSVEARAG